MVWVRIDDAFATDPKVVEAGPLAMAMQVAALCYCNQKLTDGRIPASVARTLLDWEMVDTDGRRLTIGVTSGHSGNDVTSPLVIALLVGGGMWHEPGHDCDACPQIDRGYIIHDYLDYQPTRKKVLSEREKTKGRVRQHRSRKKQRNEASNAVTNDVSNGPVTAHPVPVPVPEEITLSNQTDRTVSHGSNGHQKLPVRRLAELQSFFEAQKSNAFRLIHKRQKWPAYESVLNEWVDDLDTAGMAAAVETFIHLANNGYADSPNLFRTACEKVSLRGVARVVELVEDPDWAKEFKV